ncbi:MAG: phage portal protein, partial [Alphaproteobacteria bacterium]|nr:phage portal protein [Alphaproteobacteria bacterium]
MIRIFNNGKMTTQTSSGGSYDGTKTMGDLDNWRILSGDSNDILSSTYGLLSDRSSTLYHTYGPVRGAINKQVDYGVGPGLVFRSQPDWSTIPGMTKESGRDFGKEFQKIVHSYFQKFNFYEKQSVLFRQPMYQGDSLLFFERKNGLLNDLIEAGNNQINCNFEDKNHTLGIKHDGWLRRQGIKKTDGTSVLFENSAGDQNVVQFYFKELARQLRGYPLAYSIINLARNDDTHTDAITHRAVMESIMIGMFKSEGTDFRKQTENMASANKAKKGLPTEPGILSKISNAFRLGAGNVYTGKVGENLEFTDLKTPSNNFGPFKEWIWNYVAAAVGTPPEV